MREKQKRFKFIFLFIAFDMKILKKSNIRHKNFHLSFSVMLRVPPWIQKQVAPDSSGRRLILLISKTKRMSFCVKSWKTKFLIYNFRLKNTYFLALFSVFRMFSNGLKFYHICCPNHSCSLKLSFAPKTNKWYRAHIFPFLNLLIWTLRHFFCYSQKTFYYTSFYLSNIKRRTVVDRGLFSIFVSTFCSVSVTLVYSKMTVEYESRVGAIINWFTTVCCPSHALSKWL